MVSVIPTDAARVADYVRREGACTPGAVKCVDVDSVCPVWRVEVVEFEESVVEPPKFWYVCSSPGMGSGLNLYRNDLFRPKPWLPIDEQDEETVIDYVKSFHVGLMTRLFGKL